MAEAQRLRIRSNGTPAGTTVETEDGTPIVGLVAVSFALDARDEFLPTAIIEIENFEVDVVGAVSRPE